MFDSVKQQWRAFKSDKPGERFEGHFCRRDQATPWLRWLWLVIGLALMVFGLATTFIPPIPGITLLTLGAVICAQQSRIAARTLDRLDMWIRRSLKRLRK